MNRPPAAPVYIPSAPLRSSDYRQSLTHRFSRVEDIEFPLQLILS